MNRKRLDAIGRKIVVRSLTGLFALFTSAVFADSLSYDFATDPGGSVGTAQIVGEALQLSTNTNDNNGAFHIPAVPDSSKGFAVTFGFTIVSIGGNPADGVSFSYGPIPPGTLSTLAEEGWPNITPLLSFEIDTWENGTTEVGVGVALNNNNLAGGFTNGNLVESDTTATGTATLSWYPGVGASFTTTGLVTNADFKNVPVVFVGDDAYTFAFAARTGGANEEVLIDNLVITTGAADSDGDGLPDEWEIAYGFDENDNGENPNNNGVAGDPNNGASGDPDNDNYTNLEELLATTLPDNPDTDGDTLKDGDEAKGLAGLRPITDPRLADTDRDGLDDLLETNSGTFNGAADPGTNPILVDTDSDTTPDRREILKGTNPLDPAEFVNTSGPTRYEQDFDGYPNGTVGMNLFDGSDLHSNSPDGIVVNDALQLTLDGSGGMYSSFRIPAVQGSSNGWTATFDLSLIDGAGAGAPADGFSFNYGAIPAFDPLQTDQAAPDAHGNAEQGWGAVDHLSFEIDTWENNVDAPESGFAIAGAFDFADLEFASIPGVPILDGESIIATVTLTWDPVDGASMSSSEAGPIFDKVPTPGFTGSDEFVFGFGARTGGATETVLIDNLVVTLATSTPLVITDIEVNRTANEAVLTWSSVPGRTYAVEVSTTLEEGDPLSGDWGEISDDVDSGGDVTIFTDINIPVDATKRFYRVREVN